jgi:hypothetical protein
VVYVDNTGYAWNGLKSVQEKSPGGSPEGLYIDGFKYGQIDVVEDFEATIDAYSYPREFAVCAGTKELYNGLSVTNQPRKAFAFSYRTMINTDVTLDAGYKIHLVYGCLATPSDVVHTTFSDGADIETFSWDFTTNPPRVSGYRPTSHYIVDTRRSSGGDVTAVEDILYGTGATSPRFPTVSELLAIFSS